MIVRVNNRLFKGKYVRDKENVIEIITSNSEEGFEARKTLVGNVVFFKRILKDEADEVYDLSFQALFMGYVYDATYYDGKIILHDNGRACAIEEGFVEEEHSIWIKRVDISEITDLYVIKYDYKTKEEFKDKVSLERFIDKIDEKRIYS